MELSILNHTSIVYDSFNMIIIIGIKMLRKKPSMLITVHQKLFNLRPAQATIPP